MKVSCVATHNSGYLDTLKHACHLYDIKLDILGWNKKWQGLHSKLDYWRDYVNNCDDNEIILLLDAFDVLIIASEDEITDKFLSFNCDIVFGVEIPANRFQEYFYRKVFNPYSDEYLCTGTIIGYGRSLKTLFSSISTENTKLCDQRLVSDYISSNYENLDFTMKIDTSMSLFYTFPTKHNQLINLNDFYVSNKQVFNQKTLKRVYIIHGPFSINLNALCRELSYPLANDIHRTSIVKATFQKTYIYYETLYVSIYMFICCVIVFIILFILASIKLKRYLCKKLLKNYFRI